jgi:hypothetical protein
LHALNTHDDDDDDDECEYAEIDNILAKIKLKVKSLAKTVCIDLKCKTIQNNFENS